VGIPAFEEECLGREGTGGDDFLVTSPMETYFDVPF
jgi:hypothetical protein